MPPASAAAVATFTELYDIWYAHVARWVRSFGVRGPDQAEVTESVFFTVHGMLWHLSGPDPAAWLYRLRIDRARRKLIRLVARSLRRR